jgi:hypothetical protein
VAVPVAGLAAVFAAVAVRCLKRSAAAARASIDTCQYHLLSQRLPALVARLPRPTAIMNCLACQLCVKLGEDAMAWVTADARRVAQWRCAAWSRSSPMTGSAIW